MGCQDPATGFTVQLMVVVPVTTMSEQATLEKDTV